MYIYHRVPQGLRGDILYPLNELKEHYPHLYEHHLRKYEGRERVLEDRIPFLDNCLWNDVLFFMAVDPKEFRVACEAAGVPIAERVRYFALDPKTLDRKRMAVWMYNEGKKAAGDYGPFDMRSMRCYARLPPGTIDSYRKAMKDGRSPLLWKQITHVLYKGPLDISEARIVVA